MFQSCRRAVNLIHCLSLKPDLYQDIVRQKIYDACLVCYMFYYQIEMIFYLLTENLTHNQKLLHLLHVFQSISIKVHFQQLFCVGVRILN